MPVLCRWKRFGPPFPFRKQCPAYFRSSNAMAESFNLICISPLNFGRPKAVLLYITVVELITIYFRCVAVL